MDLRKYYLDKVSQSEYYYRFHDLVEHVNETWNAFYGTQETQNFSFEVYDAEDAIEKFKSLCMPENQDHSKEDQCWFYVILFYLYKHGYVLEQFPKLIERPPKESREFVYNDVRTRLISEGKDFNGTVRYATRRVFVGEFSFKQKSQYIGLDEDIEAKFKRISTRDTGFQAMSRDEKLAEIVNLIENLLKKNGNYQKLDYASLCDDYISDDIIKGYKKKLQCFRHSAEQSIEERNSFSNEQKDFLIDFGLVIVKAIHMLVEKDIPEK